MRQQGSDGAKLRQPHHTHDQATAPCRPATSTAAATQKPAAGRAATTSGSTADAPAAACRPSTVDAAEAIADPMATRRLAPRAPPRDAALAGTVGALLAVSI